MIDNLTAYGYVVEQKLGQNRGNVSWLARTIDSNELVVIKQFLFAKEDSSWQGYQAYQQEIELLKNLNYPGIPRYLASFETDDSFCFVREYIPGKSLAEQSAITSEVLLTIAVKTLKILDYLQQQQPPIFHLNITPENLLLDKAEDVYLINFSLARNHNSAVKSDAITIANAEFIAPEQLKSPCLASDLYGLGTTLQNVILLQQSLDVADLDEGFQVWLEKMCDRDFKQRYADAETALQALQTNSWETIDSLAINSDSLTLSHRAFSGGVVGMGILGIAIAIGSQITQTTTEKSLINITIALMGGVIIYLTQSASATIVTDEPREKKQAIAFAVGIPVILALVTGIIFGKGEAVAISLAATIAQAVTLGTVLFSRLKVEREVNKLKATSLVVAILLGLVCGTLIF